MQWLEKGPPKVPKINYVTRHGQLHSNRKGIASDEDRQKALRTHLSAAAEISFQKCAIFCSRSAVDLWSLDLEFFMIFTHFLDNAERTEIFNEFMGRPKMFNPCLKHGPF